MAGVWRSQRRSVKPPRSEEVVDLGSKFGVSLHDDDSESSDEEFEPEKAEIDSEDSHEFMGEDDSSHQSNSDSDDVAMETEEAAMETEEADTKTPSEEHKDASGQEEYNPLIVRRSNRTIKPTKDIDLYLLGAKFGVDIEGSDVDTSDAEFSPQEEDADSLSGSLTSSRSSDTRLKDETHADPTSVLPDDKSVNKISATMNNFSSSKLVDIPLCAVCLEDSQDDGDIVECDWCGISVHEGCYGVPEEDGVDDQSDLSSFTTIPWFCDTCKAGISPNTCHCDLCPNVGGLFKQSVNGRWVHVVCGLYTPGIEYVEPTQLSGVTLDQLPAARWGTKECQLCDDQLYSRTGVCISCDAGLCKSFFHVTCAQRHGLLCEMDSDDEDKELCDPYFAHCKTHMDKIIAKRKKRDYLSVLNKQKCFVRNTTDNRVQNYLDDAKKEYFALINKMQAYYRPELTFRDEERLVQYMPSAFHRLTQKARSLGYEAEVVGPRAETRRMIPPGLTAEFVNYFHERNSRISALGNELAALSQASTEMKLEETQAREELGSREHEIGLLKSKDQQILGQTNTLYFNLSRLSGKEFLVPNSLCEPQTTVGEQITKECVVCDKSHDAHLMVLCDTCDNRYHIGCVDPPLSKVPKKTARWGWQCHRCCCSSDDDLVPTLASHDEPSSLSGRRIQPPKSLLYPDLQVVEQTKKRIRRKTKQWT